MGRGGDRDRGNGRQHQHQGTDHAGGESEDRRRPRKNYGPPNKNRGRYNGKSRYNNYQGGNDRRNFKKPRFDVGERLKESDLGITEYVGNVEGFTGTIKERLNDFMVHEISLNGEIAKLTSQEIPLDPEDDIDVEELKTKIPEGVWEQLQKLHEENPDIEIDVTNIGKEQRKYIHQIVKKMTSVVSDTKEVGDKKLMVFSKEYTRKDGMRRDTRQDWSSRGGDYCHFILHKCNMDTMDALNQVAKVLRLKSSLFSYAGTKDRRARTTQWISVRKMDPRRIMSAARCIRGAFVGNFKFEKESLKLGKLYGNRFTIALRNVSASDELIEKAMVSIRDKGFINYYGLQRFGTIAAIPTHEIGKALLQGNWEEAVDLILKPRDGEQDSNLAEAREIFKNTQDSVRAYQKIGGRNDKIEAKLLWGINICGLGNLQGALDMVPRNTLLMYIHAYQSMVWNKIVSQRIKEFGLKPIAGDLVYENPDLKDEFEVHDESHSVAEDEKKTDDSNETASSSNTRVTGVGESSTITNNSVNKNETSLEETKTAPEEKDSQKVDSKTEDDKSSDKDDNERRLPKVKILTEEDLPNYTMEDIIMPQPGWKVVYPPYAKAWFEDQLEKDKLTPDLKQKNKKYTLSGSYRKILQVPQDLSWKIFRYNNRTEDLLASDMDELRENEPPKEIPDGKLKALIIQMSLKSSSYATMALREILKCDTSSQTHAAQSAAFHEAHEKEKEQAKQSGETSETDDTVPQVENLKLKDRSSDETSQSTEDEASDQKLNVTLANSTLLNDSFIEEEVQSALKSKSNSSMLSESGAEKQLASKDDANKTFPVELAKHEIDSINDSGIDAANQSINA